MKLDPWQEEVMATEGSICLRSGRQVGKSTVIGLKAAVFALNNPKKLIMVISKTDRQASLLFSKILFNITQLDKTQIKRKKDRPTKHRISLKNGSVIHCLPVGDTGYGIMGFTIDLLIADEAAFIPEAVWNSIIPALAITRGSIWLLSTPFLKEGYYYNCFQDPTFTVFHQSSEDCPRKDQQFLDHKKKTISKAEYAQMYLGEFVDDIKRFFSQDLITSTCTLQPTDRNTTHEYFLGVDIARMGEDESTFQILDGTDRDHVIQNRCHITTKTLTTDTTDKIILLNKQWEFNKIGIDDGGMGVGVFDQLLRVDDTRRKTVALNNAKRNIDREDRTKTLFKEDMYNNLLAMMERKEIKLLDDDELKLSLGSIQTEYNENGKLRITGQYSHITEGLIRAAWLVKDKSLNMWIRSLRV